MNRAQEIKEKWNKEKNNTDKSDYNFLLKTYKEFKNIQEKDKKQGLNDFNLLTTVLKYHDEVRLHSRMIGALLDPEGAHNRGSLFLEIFLKQVGLDSWFKDVKNVSVRIEYKDIDLYLSDGKKHLIIENKIWAGDQPCQIMKYINIIVEKNRQELGNPVENSLLDEKKLKVLYLTPRAKKVPSEHEVVKKTYVTFSGTKEKLNICSQRDNTKTLVPNGLKNYVVWYKKINYKEDILSWLEASQQAVQDIPNLIESIEQYKNVVLTIHNNYIKKVLDFKDYLKDNAEASSLVKLLFTISSKDMVDIAKEYEDFEKDVLNTKAEMLYEFFRGFESYFDEYENANYQVSKDKKRKKLIYNKSKCKKWFKTTGKRYLNFGTFYKINEDYLLYIFIGKSAYHFGKVKHKNYIIEDMSKDPIDDLEFRNFKSISLKWHSKKFNLLENLDIFDDFENSNFDQALKQLLGK